MKESPYVPFFKDLPKDVPLGVNDLIMIAWDRKVNECENFENMDKDRFWNTCRQSILYYREKLALPQADRETLTTEDPEYWSVPPVSWGVHGGKKYPLWYGPTWEKVGPKSLKDQLNEKMKKKGETDPLEQPPVNPDGDGQGNDENAQPTQPVPAALPLLLRLFRKGSFKFAAGFLACAFLMYCTAAVKYYNTHPEKGFVAALRFFHERVKEPDANLLLKRAYLEYGSNKLDDAEKTIVQALDQIEDRGLTADGYVLLGLIEFHKGYDDRAAKSFKAAIEMYKELGETENLFLTRIKLFRVSDVGEITFPEELSNADHSRYHKNRYFLESALAERKLANGDFQGTLMHAESAYESALKTQDVTILSWATNSLAIGKALNGLPASKEMYDAIGMAVEYEDPKLSLFNLAVQYLVYQDSEAQRVLIEISEKDKHFAKYMRWLGVVND